MGLDQYLFLEDIETGEMIEYSYFRKFNALQGYFTENYNIANPGRILLNESMMSDLYIRLNEIRYSPEKAHLLLPSFPGPFFGTYEYDRLYHSYVYQAATDFYHAKFIDYKKYRLYYASDW